MRNENSSDSVLVRAAHLLEVFSEPPFRFSYSEICGRVAMPRATVHRMLNQLVSIGYIEKSDEGKDYGLGPRLKRLVHFNLGKDELNAVFHPVLSQLANKFGKTTFAARLQGSDISIFMVAQPETPEGAQIVPGYGLRPVNACSTAKAILAFQDQALLDSLLAKPLKTFTERTISDVDTFKKEIMEVRKTRIAICDEEIDLAVISISSPVSVAGLGVLYAIGTIGLKSNFTSATVAELRNSLITSAEKIGAAL